MAASDPLVAAVATAADEYGPRLGVAVSGGGDSVALLLAAQAVGPVHAVTVDHGLRAGAAAEARWVADLCARHAIPHDIVTLALEDGPGAQARARAARYAALSDWARGRVDTVLLGHSRDDVAETLVMRLRRGVGVSGLAAMAESWEDAGGVHFARPFLAFARAELRDWLRARGQDWIDDPSNEDARFERAETRKAMAALGWDAAALARSAEALRGASRALGAQAAALARKVLTEDAAGDVLFDVAAVEAGDVARRLWLVALSHVGGGRAPRARELQDAVDALPDGQRTLAGCVLTREADGRVRIAREWGACAPPVAATEIWDRRWRIEGADGANLTLGALGEDIAQTPWRGTGLPRASLMATPALRRGATLVAAPVAGLAAGHVARRTGNLAATIRRHPSIVR